MYTCYTRLHATDICWFWSIIAKTKSVVSQTIPIQSSQMPCREANTWSPRWQMCSDMSWLMQKVHRDLIGDRWIEINFGGCDHLIVFFYVFWCFLADPGILQSFFDVDARTDQIASSSLGESVCRGCQWFRTCCNFCLGSPCQQDARCSLHDVHTAQAVDHSIESKATAGWNWLLPPSPFYIYR